MPYVYRKWMSYVMNGFQNPSFLLLQKRCRANLPCWKGENNCNIYADYFFNSCQSNAFAHTFCFLIFLALWTYDCVCGLIIFRESNIWIKAKECFRKALMYWLLINCILFFWQCCRAAYSSQRQRSCQFCFSKLSWIDRTREVACEEMQFLLLIFFFFFLLW